MGRLEGKVAWVSGSTKGIGQGIAEVFAAEGAAVAVTGRNEKDGKKVVDSIIERGGKAVYIKCDVTDEKNIKESIDKTVEAFGRLDIVVNNAANILVKMLHETTSEEWDDLMNLNVKSMFFAFKYAFQYLVKNKQSYVVNVGSINSLIANDRVPVYTTSKGAVLQLSKSIGLDYARYGIRCNVVLPGITHTPLLEYHMSHEGDFDENLKKRVRRVPIGRALSIYEVAKSVLFFACEDSAGVTATSLIVDGGMLGGAEWDTEAVKDK